MTTIFSIYRFIAISKHRRIQIHLEEFANLSLILIGILNCKTSCRNLFTWWKGSFDIGWGKISWSTCCRWRTPAKTIYRRWISNWSRPRFENVHPKKFFSGNQPRVCGTRIWYINFNVDRWVRSVQDEGKPIKDTCEVSGSSHSNVAEFPIIASKVAERYRWDNVATRNAALIHAM